MRKTFTLLGLLGLCTLFMSPRLAAQLYNDYLGAGHNQGISISSSGLADGFTNEATIDGEGIDSAYMRIQASRFLGQATLGVNRELIDEVAKQGFEAWIEEQLTLPPTYVSNELETALTVLGDRCVAAGGDPFFCYQINSGYSFFFQFGWWQTLMTAEDLLRQRVALALSEIFVVSGLTLVDEPYSYPLADYYDMLLDNAFGNYEDLLLDITYHPMMGLYLSHFNNPRTLPALNIRPDENYAREIMQLFSIGLFELNMDGSRRLDEDGEDIPTYDNDDIKQFAKIFTGFGNGAEDGSFGDAANIYESDFLVPMQMFDAWHEPGVKRLLNDFVVPAGQTGAEDVEMTINHLVNHPNTAPFISYRLIQHLVKSNPSPAYIERVAEVFVNNGEGVRGDLGAVVKAILLDEEARDCSWLSDPENGKLREPLVRYTHILKALNASNESGEYYNLPDYFYNRLRQLPMLAPTVFNFFEPDYQPNGPIADADLVAPEFQLHNAATSISYVNIALFWTFNDALMNNGLIYQAFGQEPPAEDLVTAQVAELMEIENNEVLIDELDLLLCHGLLSDGTRAILLEALNSLTAVFPPGRFPMAVYLIMISPDYTILR